MMTDQYDTIVDPTPCTAQVAALAELEPCPDAIAYFDRLVAHAAAMVEVCRNSARKAAMDYVAAGRALAELKAEMHVAPGAVQVRDTSGHFADRDTLSYSDGKGWQELCQERIGLSYKTADRYIADAEAFDALSIEAEQLPRAAEYLSAVISGEFRAAVALAALEQFKALPEKGDANVDPARWAGLEASLKSQAELVRFHEMEMAALAGDELAANELEQCAKGNIPLARAYSGWRGGTATKDKTRRDPDYARLVIKSATTFLNAWGKFYEMPTERRRAAADSIVAVMTTDDLPDEVGREIYAKLASRYGQAATRG